MQYGRMQWDDLQYALAIARAGSASRAAGLLGVNQTTVLRRLDALEAVVGTPIFERRRSGQTLTVVGRIVVDAAERIEQEAEALKNAIAAQQRSLSGTVRVTTSDTLAMRLVTPCLRTFYAQYPGVTVELIITDKQLDIARGEADVALRANSRPQGAGIVARRLPDVGWTIYCSRGYAAERGAPASRAAIPGHDIVGMEGQMGELPGSLWLAASAPGTVIRVRSNSLVNLVWDLKAGLGLGALPVLIGDHEPELIRCFAPPPELKAEIWLIVREAIKQQAHVRAFTDFLANHIREAFGELQETS
jgi:molybdate transport repressor ModE-like protein